MCAVCGIVCRVETVRAKIGKLKKKGDRRPSTKGSRINVVVMEQIPTTSSGGNATAAPSSAGPSFTPPTPVQPSDNNCIDKRLQSVSESEYQDDEYDEPDHQMYLSGSSGSEGELSEVRIYHNNIYHIVMYARLIYTSLLV